jgi:hypothetical protein
VLKEKQGRQALLVHKDQKVFKVFKVIRAKLELQVPLALLEVQEILVQLVQLEPRVQIPQ